MEACLLRALIAEIAADVKAAYNLSGEGEPVYPLESDDLTFDAADRAEDYRGKERLWRKRRAAR